jgi:hypothetical protein
MEERRKGIRHISFFLHYNSHFYSIEYLQHGRGALFLPNGDSFEGEWIEGEINGAVFYKFADGSPWRDPEY